MKGSHLSLGFIVNTIVFWEGSIVLRRGPFFVSSKFFFAKVSDSACQHPLMSGSSISMGSVISLGSLGLLRIQKASFFRREWKLMNV